MSDPNDPWDPEKSDTCFKERGFDFAYASQVFDGETFELEDMRERYGERRIKAIGVIDGRVYAVVYTPRDGRKRIISARLADEQEIRAWQNYMSPPVKPGREAGWTSKRSKQLRKLKSKHKWPKTGKTRKHR